MFKIEYKQIEWPCWSTQWWLPIQTWSILIQSVWFEQGIKSPGHPKCPCVTVKTKVKTLVWIKIIDLPWIINRCIKSKKIVDLIIITLTTDVENAIEYFHLFFVRLSWIFCNLKTAIRLLFLFFFYFKSTWQNLHNEKYFFRFLLTWLSVLAMPLHQIFLFSQGIHFVWVNKNSLRYGF